MWPLISVMGTRPSVVISMEVSISVAESFEAEFDGGG